MKIYIIGCGGFAKEVNFLLKTLKYEICGFIDKNNLNKIFCNLPIIDEDDFLNNYKNENVCIGIGNPNIIKNIYHKYKNFNFPNIIHPSVIFDEKNIRFGKGNILCAGVNITTDIIIGNLNIFNLNMTIGHDSIIGDFNVFNPSVNISGNCRIGNSNLFGVGSVVIEKKTIGDRNVLGANSTLITNILDDALFVGSPAKEKIKN